MMQKLKMLQPRLATLDPWKAQGRTMAHDLKQKPWLKLEDIRTARWTKAKNGRLLPLNNAAWAKLRKSVLQEQPLCPECQARGLIEVATQVHHQNDNACDNSRENLVGLCASCHSKHTASDMGGNVRMGCDMTGTPLDSTHHWNKPTAPVLVRPAEDEIERSPATDGHEPTGFPSSNANC